MASTCQHQNLCPKFLVGVVVVVLVVVAVVGGVGGASEVKWMKEYLTRAKNVQIQEVVRVGLQNWDDDE